MSKRLILVSVLLFFQASVLAAPSQQMPPESKTEEPDSPKKLNEDMVISEPAPVLSEVKPDPQYYVYQSALTFRAGVGFQDDRPKPLDGFQIDDAVLGFQYMFPKFLSPKLEAGADIHPAGVGHIHGGMRWIANQRSYVRPSAKLALDHRFKGSQNLGTFGHIDNWFGRLALTFEFVTRLPYSVRLEVEGLANINGEQQSVFTVGLSRGW